MDEYTPNSYKYKEEQAKKAAETREIQKVVSRPAQIKKKSEFSKLANSFVSEDAQNVKSYILTDVLVPAIKKLISDIVKDGIEMVLYGTTGGSRKSSKGKVSYRDYYDNGSRPVASHASSRFDYDDISFETRGEAEAIREQMEDIIARYGFVTVADLYDMADLTAPYTANKYGWTGIRNAEVMRGRDGRYFVKLPRAVPIG